MKVYMHPTSPLNIVIEYMGDIETGITPIVKTVDQDNLNDSSLKLKLRCLKYTTLIHLILLSIVLSSLFFEVISYEISCLIEICIIISYLFYVYTHVFYDEETWTS